MKRTKERADARELQVRAIHEAAHAVFTWRAGEVFYGDNWNDRIAPFEAIILSPYVGDSPPPLVFRGERRDALGCVFTHEINALNYLNIQVTGGSRRRRDAIQQRFKLKARLAIICHLSGPIAEEHFICHQEGDERPYFDWSGEFEAAEFDGIETDATKAYALAKALWRSWPRRQIRCLNDAVDEIEAKLNGDPRYWRTIKALAAALLTRKTYRIGHNAAVRVMRQAWRKTGTENRLSGGNRVAEG